MVWPTLGSRTAKEQEQEFEAAGPATENARRLNMERWCRGMNS